MGKEKTILDERSEHVASVSWLLAKGKQSKGRKFALRSAGRMVPVADRLLAPELKN